MKEIARTKRHSGARANVNAEASPIPVPAELIQRRRLEKTVAWTGRERLRCLWYRLRLNVAEMNYATRRVVEVQAPWIAGDRPAEPAGAQTRGAGTSPAAALRRL